MSEHEHEHGHEHGHQEVEWTASFWDDRYGSAEQIWSGNPNAVVVAETTHLAPGTALDVGCGEGGDAIWLATQGWQVEGVDVSQVALDRAAAAAERAGVAGRTTWTQRDLLAWTPPEAAYDLVSVPFFHVPPDVRPRVYAGLARAVAPGGTLLVVAHHPHDLSAVQHPHDPALYFTPAQVAAEALDATWTIEVQEARPRAATVEGAEVTLHDAVLRATR